jgi:hypothetical protein
MFFISSPHFSHEEMLEVTRRIYFDEPSVLDSDPARVAIVEPSGAPVKIFGPMELETGRIVWVVADPTGVIAAAEPERLEEVIQRERVGEAQATALNAVEGLDEASYSTALSLSNLRAKGHWRPMVKIKGAPAWSAFCRERLETSPKFVNALVEQARGINRTIASGAFPLPAGFPEDDATLGAFGRFERALGDVIPALNDTREAPEWSAEQTRQTVEEMRQALASLRGKIESANDLGQTALNAASVFGDATEGVDANDPQAVEQAFRKTFEKLFGNMVGTFGRCAAISEYLED